MKKWEVIREFTMITAATIIVAAVIMAAGLLTTPFITVLRKEEEGATAKQPAAAGLDELEPAAR